jgi:hypothetical protein
MISQGNKWWLKVDSLIEGSADFEGFVETLFGFFFDTRIGGEMGESEALSSRMVWHFADDTVLWVTSRHETFLSHLEQEYRRSSALPLMPGVAEQDFEYSRNANGWAYTGALGTLTLVNSLAAAHGAVTLVLPWAEIIGKLLDDFDEVFDIYCGWGDEDASDEERERRSEGVRRLVTALDAEELGVPGEVWSILVCSGEDFMPKYSHVGRFRSFLDSLEEQGWTVLREECCFSCVRGSLDAIRSESQHGSLHAFVTWEQNADSSWGVSGWVDHSWGVDRAEDANFLAEVAAQCGLTANREDIPERKGNDWFARIHIS